MNESTPSPSRLLKASATIAQWTLWLLATAWLVLALAWGVKIFSGRTPWRMITALALLLGPFLLFTNAYRDQVRSKNTTVVTATGAASLLVPTIQRVATETSISEVEESLQQFFFARFRGIDGVAIVTEKTPNDIPYISYGRSLATVPSSLVPRFIWKNKPVYVDGLDFARQYFRQSDAVFNSLTPTVVGDLYRRGGPAVVVLGMLTLGRLARAISRSAAVGSNRRRFVLLVPFAILLIDLESGVVLLPASLLQLAVCVYVAIILLTPEWRNDGGPGANMAPLRKEGLPANSKVTVAQSAETSLVNPTQATPLSS